MEPYDTEIDTKKAVKYLNGCFIEWRFVGNPVLVGFKGDFSTTNHDSKNMSHDNIAVERPPELLLILLEQGADPNQTWFTGTQQLYIVQDSIKEIFVLYLAGGHVGRTDYWARKTSALQALEVQAGREWEREYLRTMSSSQLSALTRKVLCLYARTIINRAGVGICIGLRSLDLPELIVCEILQAYHHTWPLVPFHCYWQLATTVKHFSANQGE